MDLKDFYLTIENKVSTDGIFCNFGCGYIAISSVPSNDISRCILFDEDLEYGDLETCEEDFLIRCFLCEKHFK